MNTNRVSRKGKESGQTLVLVAVLLVGLIAVLALALDGGNIYLQRRRMQNAADAGAIAAARVLALNGTEDEARAAAQEYTVQRNQADSCEITIDASGITVVAYKNAQMVFAPVVGVDQVTATARAAATFEPVSGAKEVAPIAIRNFDYEFGAEYTIWDDDTTEPPDPTTGSISGSYRGWLNLDCVYPASCGDPGADNLKDWMLNGYPDITQVDTWLQGSSGVKTAVVAQAQVGQLLNMAVYDDIQDLYPNQSYYHILKIAAFRVTEVYDTAVPKGIKGVFEYSFIPGPPGGTDDGGVRTISLTQ